MPQVIAQFVDSDLQDPPELMAEMITKYEKGFDVVHTVRKKGLVNPGLNYF